MSCRLTCFPIVAVCVAILGCGESATTDHGATYGGDALEARSQTLRIRATPAPIPIAGDNGGVTELAPEVAAPAPAIVAEGEPTDPEVAGGDGGLNVDFWEAEAAAPIAEPQPSPDVDLGATAAPDLERAPPIIAAQRPCDGLNFANNNHNDNVFAGGPMVGVEWVPQVTGPIRRLEVYTGEHVGPNQVAIWSDSGGGQPQAPLGWSDPFTTTLTKGWQGANLLNPVNVTAGNTYWLLWDPEGGEQTSASNHPADQLTTYWGSYSGDVTGGASWFGPFASEQIKYKFRAFCGPRPCDGNNYANENHVDNIFMGGPLVGIEWFPAVTDTLKRIEIYTGEVAAPNRLAIWSDDGGAPSQPLAAMGTTNTFTTTLAKGWQGAILTTPVSVSAGAKYWIVWDPSGGEQASVSDDLGDIQQSYWGSYSGDVTGGASWFGPFSGPSHRWKFRLFCGRGPCEGNNYDKDNYLDNVSMGGPLVGIDWYPNSSALVSRIEIYTGEVTAPNRLAIWSDNGRIPSQPGAFLAATRSFTTGSANGWQGANLMRPLFVRARTKYWVVWDPAGGEQASVTDDPNDIQQTYWGSYSGTVTGGTSWYGPFSFPDRRWKFRMFCLCIRPHAEGALLSESPLTLARLRCAQPVLDVQLAGDRISVRR